MAQCSKCKNIDEFAVTCDGCTVHFVRNVKNYVIIVKINMSVKIVI